MPQILVKATENMQCKHICTRPHLDIDDAETMFLLSLRNTLKSFDAEQLRRAQMRIHEVLYEIEFNK